MIFSENRFPLFRIMLSSPYEKGAQYGLRPIAPYAPYRACLPMNSIIRANMSPVWERSGERPVWRSESM
jgi:hypothetical protein